MAKVRPIDREQEGIEDWLFHCPGCECGHAIRSKGPSPCWSFNGDVNKPTFSPSYLIPHQEIRCHSYIEDGLIKFQSDCYHKLAGQTVELPEEE